MRDQPDNAARQEAPPGGHGPARRGASAGAGSVGSTPPGDLIGGRLTCAHRQKRSVRPCQQPSRRPALHGACAASGRPLMPAERGRCSRARHCSSVRLDSFGLSALDDRHTAAPPSARPVHHQLEKPRTPSALSGAVHSSASTPCPRPWSRTTSKPVIGDRPWCRQR